MGSNNKLGLTALNHFLSQSLVFRLQAAGEPGYLYT